MNTDADQCLRHYWSTIDGYSLLTADQEQELAARGQKGDQSAIDELVLANLRLVVQIAHEYKNRGMEWDDLVAEGNIGLLTAARKYRPGTGAKFSTYASWWIHQIIRRRSLEWHPLFHIPGPAKKVFLDVEREAYVNEELGGFESPETVSEVVNDRKRIAARQTACACRTIRISVEKLEKLNIPNINDMVRSTRERHKLIANGEEISIDAHDMSKIIKKEEELVVSSKLLSLMTKQESTVLRSYYGLDTDIPLTQEEIGRNMGCTTQRVSQILISARAKLRRLLDDSTYNGRYRKAMSGRC